MSLKYLGKKNILIVEDDVFNMQLLQTLLNKLSDMHIIPSYDGSEALQVLQNAKEKIDMVLLDLHLPIVNGMDLLMHIRQYYKIEELPVLVISVDQREKAELFQMGANEFIHKPFDIDDLVSKISLHLKQ